MNKNEQNGTEASVDAICHKSYKEQERSVSSSDPSDPSD